jgi:hypothetical protein
MMQHNNGVSSQTVAKKTSSEYDWNKKLEDIKSGKLNPKEVALNLLEQLSPMQKRFLKMSLPKFQIFAGKYVSDENLNSFLTEIKSRL